jgi:hypothetical protein
VRKNPFIGQLGEWRRREAGDWRWSLTPPVSKSKKGDSSRWGTELEQGKRRSSGSASLRLLTRMGGWPTVISGAVVLIGAAAALLCQEEDDPGVLGWSGAKLGRELGRLQKIIGKWKT